MNTKIRNVLLAVVPAAALCGALALHSGSPDHAPSDAGAKPEAQAAPVAPAADFRVLQLQKHQIDVRGTCTNEDGGWGCPAIDPKTLKYDPALAEKLTQGAKVQP